MLIVFVSIAVLGLSIFIVQWIKQVNTDEISSRCLYNAYAGVNYSLYQFRNSASLANGTININPNNNFTLSTVSGGGGGGQSSSLEINATNSSLSANRQDILGITLRNTSASPITLSQMIIYIGSGTKTLDAVRINGSDVWTVNTLIGTSPVTLNMTDVTIPANTTRTVNRIRWTSSMSGQTVYWGFIMSDLTATPICTVYPRPASPCQSSGSLTIKSMGKVAGSNIYRSVQAVYDTASAKITDYDEIAQTVP
jgi:hypothetical protein